MRITTILFILFLSHSLFAQIDSIKLRQKLDSIKLLEGQDIVNEELGDLYYDVGKMMYDNKEYRAGLGFAKKALDVRTKFVESTHLKTALAYELLGHVKYATFGYINFIDTIPESATDLYRQALLFRKQEYGDSNNETAISIIRLSKSLYQENQLNEADSLSKIAFQIQKKELTEHHPDILKTLFVRSAILKAKGQIDGAIAINESILKLRIDSLGLINPDVSLTYNALGKMYFLKKDYISASEKFKQCILIDSTLYGSDDIRLSFNYTNLSKTLILRQKIDEASKACEKALNIQKLSLANNHPKLLSTMDALASIYSGLRKYDKAINVFEDIIEKLTDSLGANHLSITIPMGNIAHIQIVTGDFDKAKQNYENVIQIIKDTLGAESLRLTGYYDGLTSIYTQKGELIKAREVAYKSLNIKSTLSNVDSLSMATSFYRLSHIYEKLGSYKEALHLGGKALNIRLRNYKEKHPNTAYAYNNLAQIYLARNDRNDNEKALDYYEKAIIILESIFGVHHHQVGVSKANIAQIYINLGMYSKAKELTISACDILENDLKKNHHATLQCRMQLAVIHSKLEEYLTAIEILNEVIKIQHEKRHRHVHLSRLKLIEIYASVGNYDTADSLWQIAIPRNIEDSKNNFIYLPDNERVNYLNTLKNIYDSFYFFVFNHGSEDTKIMATNLLINTKARSLDYAVSTSQLIQNIRDDKLQSKFNRLRGVRNKINQAEQPSASSDEVDLFALNQEREQLSSEILSHPDIQSRLNQRDFTWKDARSKLKRNEAILDFIHYEDEFGDSTEVKYAVVIIKKRQQPILIPLTIENDIQALFESNVTYPLYLQKSIYDNAHELYKKLWRPLEPHLKNIKTIHLSPSGLLHRLDFDVLRNDEDKRLIEHYEFHYFNATRDFITKKKKSSSVYDDAVAMGHILYDLSEEDQYKKREDLVAILPYESGPRDPREEVKPLPYTLSEVKQLMDKCTEADIRYNVLTRNQATEDTIQFFTGERSPSILHLATHGTYVEHADASAKNNDNGFVSQLSAVDNPLQRSVLMLYGANHTWHKNEPIFGTESDGILTAAEVALLDLKKTKLVTLSACKTGLGSLNDTEGVFGLQRAFKLAGADAILVSLWPVDDEATQKLMNHFYENLLIKKQKPSVALRNAKLTLRDFYKDGMDDQPNLWGGFILVE